MKNFNDSNIIVDVAVHKDKTKFISKNDQIKINKQLKVKLLRFVDEMVSVKHRPKSMQLFDNIMNDMHGKRVKDLYQFRKNGGHIIALLCHAIPPELIYAFDNCIPVNVCMGAEELETYALPNTQGMCSILQSMSGFLQSGMCVFFNLADYIVATNNCCFISQIAEIISQIPNSIETLIINHDFFQKGNNLSFNLHFNHEKFIQYAQLYQEIREIFQKIMMYRKLDNPPIDGKNSLWIQQILLVEPPHTLLKALKSLNQELKGYIDCNIGYNSSGLKKRMMLISPRIMPPFSEIFRIIENSNAIVVHEEICMGLTNFDYSFETALSLSDQNKNRLLNYLLETVTTTSCACSQDFNSDYLIKKVEEFNIEGVILYAFNDCFSMSNKLKNIARLFDQHQIPSIILKTNYKEIYEQESLLMEQMSNFLGNI